MNERLRSTVEEIYAEGRVFDAAESDWTKRWRNIDPPVGEFLWIFLRAMGAKAVLEVGTSNGYSTIWLADAVRENGGSLVSVERDPALIKLAEANLRRAGLDEFVELRNGEADDLLVHLPDASLDVLFLDGERSEYSQWWPHPKRVLRHGGVLIVDNATSHPHEVEDLYKQIRAEPAFTASVIPVGKGELIAIRD